MNGILVCGLADGSRVEVPARMAGKMIHDPKDGRPFIVPALPESAGPTSEAGAHAAGSPATVGQSFSLGKSGLSPRPRS